MLGYIVPRKTGAGGGLLVLVLGLPGPLAESCESVALRLLRQAYGSAASIRADTLEEVSLHLLRTRMPQAVIASHEARGDIRRAIAEAGARFIVALDDPRAALCRLVNRREADIIAATRRVANGCAATASFSTAQEALVLDVDRDGIDARALAAAIAPHLRLGFSAEEMPDLLGAPEDDFGIRAVDAAALSWTDLNPAERALAEGAIGPFVDYFAGRGLGPIAWAPELFFVGDHSSGPVAGAIDITGRARCLLSGPDILLPPGTWSLTMALDFSAAAAEHGFVLELRAGAPLAHAVIRSETAGVFEARFAVVLDDLPQRPLDFRLSSERAAFDGAVRLLGVSATRQP